MDLNHIELIAKQTILFVFQNHVIERNFSEMTRQLFLYMRRLSAGSWLKQWFVLVCLLDNYKEKKAAILQEPVSWDVTFA